jgi:O-antigen/teichoic acid export membrane protein
MGLDKHATSLTQKAYLNTLSSFLDYFARILVSLVVTPILLTGLGSAVFGIWQVLNKLVGYISAVDGRPTQALKWLIANQQESDDVQVKQRAVGSALGIWMLLLPVLVAAGAVLTWASPWIVKAPDNIRTLVRITFLILSVNIILGIAASIPESVLRGMNLGYKRMGLVAALNILGGLFTAGAIYMNWGIIGVASTQVMLTIITGILFWSLVKAYVPWFGIKRVSFNEIYRFFQLTVWYSAWNLVKLLLVASDIIVLGIVMSASAVTEYVLTGYAANALLAVVTLIIGAAAPGLGGLMGSKMYTKVIEIRNEMLCIICLLGAVFGSVILFWNQTFVSLWVGRQYYAGPWVNLLLVLIVIQLLLIWNEAYIIDLTLNVRRKVVIGLMSAVMSIGLALFLIPTLGIVGLCIAILISRTILWISLTLINSAYLGARLGGYINTVLRPLFVMTVGLLLLTSLGKNVLIADWVRFSVYGCLSVPLFFVFQFKLGFSSAQRDQLIQRTNLIKVHLGNYFDRKIEGGTV